MQFVAIKRPWALMSLFTALVFAPLSSIGVQPALAASDLTTGLVGYWNFENGSTLGTPLYGTLNLTTVGTPAYTATGGNNSSKGLSLNGSSYLQNTSYPSTLNGNNPYTIAAWFNSTQGNAGGILGYGSTGTCIGNNLRLDGSTRFLSYWYGCDYGSNSVSNFLNSWHHVAVSYDGTTLKFYYDGTLLSSHTGLTRNTTGTTLYVGKTVNDVAFSGTLDDIALYTRALTAQEVSDLKNGQLNFNDSTTVSMSVSGNPRTIIYRQALSLSATSSIDGKITFRANGKSIAGCVGVSTVSLIATCSWKPTVKGATRLTAQIIPTQSVSNASATSTTYWIQVLPRSSRRG